MAGGKHQYAIKLVGEAIARKLGNALDRADHPARGRQPRRQVPRMGQPLPHAGDVPGRRPRRRHEPQEPGLQAHRPDGRQRRQHRRPARRGAGSVGEVGRRRPASSTSPSTTTGPARAACATSSTSNGIPEKINADGIHDEYGLTAVMMAYDPKLVRVRRARRRRQDHDQRREHPARRKRRSSSARRSSSSARTSPSRRSRRRLEPANSTPELKGTTPPARNPL